MDSRVDAEVLIGGKVYTLSGYESEEYFQKVASYINNKMAEYGKVDSFKKLPMDMQSVLMQINIADDYFKAKKQISILEEEVKAKEKELYDLKHELISYQIKLENSEKNVRSLNTMAVLSLCIVVMFVIKVCVMPTPATGIIVLVFFIASLFCEVLAHVFAKAVNYKEENDLTI